MRNSFSASAVSTAAPTSWAVSTALGPSKASSSDSIRPCGASRRRQAASPFFAGKRCGNLRLAASREMLAARGVRKWRWPLTLKLAGVSSVCFAIMGMSSLPWRPPLPPTYDLTETAASVWADSRGWTPQRGLDFPRTPISIQRGGTSADASGWKSRFTMLHNPKRSSPDIAALFIYREDPHQRRIALHFSHGADAGVPYGSSHIFMHFNANILQFNVLFTQW